MAETTPQWNREKVKKVLEVLRELKDFDRVPLPMEIHKEFDIPLNKPRNENVMTYFENYMKIQSMPVDSVQIIDGTKVHKDVVFPTSILKPFEMPEELKPEGPQVIVHTIEEKVFSDEVAQSTDLPALKDETDA